MRILISDGDERIRDYLSGLLRGLGTVDEVATGGDALGAFVAAWREGEPYSLVFSELDMPGVAALREVEARHGVGPWDGARIVSFAPDALPGDVLVSFHSRMDAFLPKPFFADDVWAVLGQLGLLRRAA